MESQQMRIAGESEKAMTRKFGFTVKTLEAVTCPEGTGGLTNEIKGYAAKPSISILGYRGIQAKPARWLSTSRSAQRCRRPVGALPKSR
jgi:hypothetical protein